MTMADEGAGVGYVINRHRVGKGRSTAVGRAAKSLTFMVVPCSLVYVYPDCTATQSSKTGDHPKNSTCQTTLGPFSFLDMLSGRTCRMVFHLKPSNSFC